MFTKVLQMRMFSDFEVMHVTDTEVKIISAIDTRPIRT